MTDERDFSPGETHGYPDLSDWDADELERASIVVDRSIAHSLLEGDPYWEQLFKGADERSARLMEVAA